MTPSIKLVIMGTLMGIAGIVLLFRVDWRLGVGIIGLWLAGVCLEASKR